jgi:Matrixin
MPIEVPVAAHRLFGTGGTAGSPVIDMGHGTRRSVEEIRAFFSDEPSLPYTAGWSVNRLWAPRDVAFALTVIQDHMIDSDKADLLSRDVRDEPDWLRFNRRGAINIYFLHDMEGAWGKGGAAAHPNRYRVPHNRVIVADRWHVDEGHLSREESWREDVVVVAHELGHALTLPHTSNPANVMFATKRHAIRWS